MASLNGKRVLVLGLGISGQSAAQFLLNRGASVYGIDRNRQLSLENPKVAELCGKGMTFAHEEDHLDLKSFDLMVVSPGIPPENPVYRQARENHVEMIGEVELACREISQKCVGITGTNGKTTVTLLTTHVLKQAGIKAKALGNVGTPLTAAIDDAENSEETDVFVLELSSFQLETLQARCLAAGVILNITPDHLDRYPSMDAYALAKIGMERNIQAGGSLFIEEQCLKQYGRLFSLPVLESYGYGSQNALYTDKHYLYWKGERVFALPEKDRGKRSHDIENIMASYALCRALGVSSEQFFRGTDSFQKPAHRIEFVRTLEGVHYYDDSKGTNIDSVIRAVDSLNGEILLIAGGVDKGYPYTPWIDAFKSKVKAIFAIGQAKEKIKNDLESHMPVMLCSDLKDAVIQAQKLAKPGDHILLSPGCSSFDMFKDYVHRGQEFQRIVHAL